MTVLFKFCTASGAIKILEGNSIFITSPLDLNDPFEMRPAWTEEHEARRHDNEQLRSELTQGIPLYVVTKGDKVVPAGITMLASNKTCRYGASCSSTLP